MPLFKPQAQVLFNLFGMSELPQLLLSRGINHFVVTACAVSPSGIATITMSSANAKIGHPAPDFKATAVVDGQFKDIKLSDYKGNLVLFHKEYLMPCLIGVDQKSIHMSCSPQGSM